MVKEWGVKNIKLCVIVASPEGIETFHAVSLYLELCHGATARVLLLARE
jgi:hypothetical protein